MNNINLKDKLIESLGKVYYMEAFSHLTEFLQGELYVLHFLNENQDKEINPSILSDKLHMTRPRVTATLSTLRNKGYVTTVNSEDDRRKIFVSLTPKGKSFILEKQKNVEQYFEMIVTGLGEENALELIRLIELSVKLMDVNDNNN